MKVIINNEDSFILFFNKLNNINLSDNYEEEFKKIFLRLKKYYNINIYGFYNVIVYINNYYGTILKIEKDKDLDIFYKQVDMHIVIEKDYIILYKVKDYFFIKNLDSFNIYYYEDNFYLEIKKQLRNKEMYNLIENSEIVFENIDIIKNKGEIINIKSY